MPPFQEYTYILQVVDHLSKYGYVRPVKTRTLLEVGRALITIVSNSITPRILQSDNGAEVCCPFFRCLLFCFLLFFSVFVLSIFPLFYILIFFVS
jgi:hypothetical protein